MSGRLSRSRVATTCWSREIPYKNRCNLVAMCLPGRESGGLPPELSSRRTPAGAPPPELQWASINWGAQSFLPWYYILYYIDIYILYKIILYRYRAPGLRKGQQSLSPPCSSNRPLKNKSRLRGSGSLGQMSMGNNMGFMNLQSYRHHKLHILKGTETEGNSSRRELFPKSYFQQTASKTCFLELIYYVNSLEKHNNMSPLNRSRHYP